MMYTLTRTRKWSHPLREDVSWNIDAVEQKVEGVLSSSSWGCELKYFCLEIKNQTFSVILFVRMWVEIIFYTDGACSGNRHPLREDVSWNKESKYIDEELRRHPLREDVSWNDNPELLEEENVHVILFVRMWVEMECPVHFRKMSSVILFVRMWVEITKPVVN